MFAADDFEIDPESASVFVILLLLVRGSVDDVLLPISLSCSLRFRAWAVRVGIVIVV